MARFIIFRNLVACLYWLTVGCGHYCLVAKSILTLTRSLLDDCESTEHHNYSTFTEAISREADETLVDKELQHPDWFNLSKTILPEAIATRDKVMQEYIHAINELVRCEARSKLRWARKHLKGVIKVAK